MCRVSKPDLVLATGPRESESTDHQPFIQTIEVYTDGERPACARALVYEIAPGYLAVAPNYLRETAGPDIEWDWPACGMPISFSKPITNLEEARRLLIAWASYAVATHAEVLR
jgi:hypothetical protein